MGTTLAVVQSVWIVPCFKKARKNGVNVGVSSSASVLSSLVDMLSGPVALCSLCVHRSLWMPCGVSTGDWFHTSVGVRQRGCLLSPTLFNIFLEDIMTHALENFNGTISIGGRQITNLRFADEIDGITGDEDKLTELVHNLDTAASKFGMEISAEKTKIPLQIHRCHNL